MPAPRALLVALAALSVTVAAACSSDDGGDRSAAGTSSTVEDGATGVPSTTVVAGTAGRWVVGPTDLPDTWGGLQVDTEAASDPDACGIDVGDPALVVDRVTTAYDTTDDEGLNLGSTGLLTADAGIAADLADRVLSGEVASCFEDRLARSFGAEGLEVRDLDVGHGSIPEGAHTTLSYEVVVNGVAQRIEQEQVVMVEGDRVALLSFSSADAAFPADLRADLLATVGGRLREP